MQNDNSDQADSVHNFVLECSALPSPEVSGREELAEWKAEIGDGVQALCEGSSLPGMKFFAECSGNVLIGL